MKKITLLAVAALAISFASCKKDRTCTCTKTDTVPGNVAETITTVYKKSKKSEARLYCQNTVETYVQGNTTVTTTDNCTLK